jgi:predicted ATPase/DNA-binding CsgD family transcriptional regulator
MTEVISRAPPIDRPAREPSSPLGMWPPEASTLFGRGDEVDLLRDQLLQPDVRLVTIVGPGGVGKTRLASSVARSLLGHASVRDGVWFVDLSAATTPTTVVSTLARTLGVNAGGPSTTLAGLEAFIAKGRHLIVLDTFEQALDAVSEIGQLISASSDTTFLVTSREPLRLRTERTLPLMPLALPGQGRLLSPAELEQVPAVALFVDRARASSPSFRLDETNAASVAELCIRLDGLPLAIELVAARAAQLGPATTLARLDQRLPVPGPGPRDAPARQQSLLATLKWSLDLLERPEQALFKRLAVFAGGWTLAAAEAVAGPDVNDVLEALTSLADKSLIVVQGSYQGHAGDPRFRMLDTARSHALEMLEATDELSEVQLRHARHYADVAEEAAGQMEGADQGRTVARLEPEEGNFRQALEWARTSGCQDAVEEGLRLVGALAWYWYLHGYPQEAREWFDALLGPASDDDVLADGHGTRAAVLRAKVLNAAGFWATDQGEYQLGSTFHERALAVWRQGRDIPGLVASLHGVGDTALWLGNVELAERSYNEGLALGRTDGTPIDIALFAFHLGQLSWLVNRLDAAERYADEALAVAREAGSTTWPSYARFVLASVAHERGDVERAGGLYRDAIALAWKHHDRLGVRVALPGLAALAGLEGDAVRAVVLAGAASALEESAGIWAFPPIRQRHERWQQAAERGLDADRRAAAWEEGRGLSIEETVARALEPPAKGGGRDLTDPLSPREREVLELLALGRSNREIADVLFLTEHTIKYHVASLFNKLGATKRAEAVTRAIANGMISPPRD